jgi:LmbE family N-acetylglucosaminyl deacetylase
MPRPVAIAISAHPDDIEFYMAGTLLMLKQAGYAIHYLNLASGNCGSAEYNSAMTRSIRHTEARAAAKVLSAQLAMEDMALAVGAMSKKFKYAEGWRRHLHFGFCSPEADPLAQALGKNYLVNQAYKRSLQEGV